jgi:hypothetical protein
MTAHTPSAVAVKYDVTAAAAPPAILHPTNHQGSLLPDLPPACCLSPCLPACLSTVLHVRSWVCAAGTCASATTATTWERSREHCPSPQQPCCSTRHSCQPQARASSNACSTRQRLPRGRTGLSWRRRCLRCLRAQLLRHPAHLWVWHKPRRRRNVSVCWWS